MNSSSVANQKLLRHIFVALLIDIAAFTVILPLFPKLMEYYQQKSLQGQDDFYAQFLGLVGGWWKYITKGGLADVGSRNVDIVLAGGALGSLFSFLQFVSSPLIGRLSDKLGRKRTLLITMMGNIVSAALWIFSKQFVYFVMARVVGGLSEGNVQLSIAMITDITDEKSRTRGLALVGIAFAVGFTFGPAIGAYVANIDMAAYFPQLAQYGLNNFSAVAALTFILLFVETMYIWIMIPETMESPLDYQQQQRISEKEQSQRLPSPEDGIKSSSRQRKTRASTATALADRKLSFQKSRRLVSFCTFLYLFFFSGMEFTLTFLTYERFKYSNMQQGKFLGVIGIFSSLIQGGYVRRMAHKVGERRIVMQGLFLGIFASALLAVVGTPYDPLGQGWTLALAGACFAFASATVVNGFTAMFSLFIDEQSPAEKASKGELLGRHRSMGQLGRALGPISICSLYWLLGSLKTYLIVSAGICAVLLVTSWLIKKRVNPNDIKTAASVVLSSSSPSTSRNTRKLK